MLISIKNPEITEILKNISETASLIFKNGWADGNSGNLSVNITGLINKNHKIQTENSFGLNKSHNSIAGNYILITNAGSRIRDLETNPINNLCIVYIQPDSKNYSLFSFDKDSKPTSEILAHLAIHNFIKKSGRKEKVVLHTHPLEIISVSHIKKYCSEKALNKLIWNMQPESKIVFPKGIGFVNYCLTGSPELAKKTIHAFKNRAIVIWGKHGCISIGENIFSAYDKTDTLVKSLKVFFLCKSIGENPTGITSNQIKLIENTFNK